ncbi:MAG: Phosphoenolpyruvate carboxykinase C-terminal P-loop domain, partial [Solirubrobacteraceae bacterium]|nr:Phosphoenolpyruvate carboxykinase C-terminal P-loop domain [Solirubrobacteraceae bacterium]
EDLEQVVTVDPEAFKAQLPQVREFLAKFGDDLPPEMGAQLAAFEERLG